MANIHKPNENIKTNVATVYISRTSNASPAIYTSMKNYDLAWFLVHVHSVVAGGSLSCQMRESVGAAGANAALKAPVVLTAVGLDDNLFARGEDMSVNTGYTHLGLVCTEGGGSAVTVSAVLCRLRARYKQAILLA